MSVFTDESVSHDRHELQRVAMDCINDVIVTIDQDDRIILFANDAIETVFGYSVEDMVGKEVTVLMPERYRDSHRAGLKRYVTTGVRTLNWKSTAVVGLHRSGAEIPLEVSYGEYARGGKRYGDVPVAVEI